jgi:hypothetical protein
MNTIKWSRPKWIGDYRTWSGNKGEFKVTYNDTFQGVKTAGPHYMATVRRDKPGGHYYDFVIPHKRFRTLTAAQDACEKLARKQCHSMNTNVPAATPPKNSKASRDRLVSVLLAAKQTASSDKSPKPESHSLEVVWSRKRRGELVGVGATEQDEDVAEYTESLRHQDLAPHTPGLEHLANILEGTAMSIEAGLMMLGVDGDTYDVNEIEESLCDAGIETCDGCGWWFTCAELVPDDDEGDHDALVGNCAECRKEMA